MKFCSPGLNLPAQIHQIRFFFVLPPPILHMQTCSHRRLQARADGAGDDLKLSSESETGRPRATTSCKVQSDLKPGRPAPATRTGSSALRPRAAGAAAAAGDETAPAGQCPMRRPAAATSIHADLIDRSRSLDASRTRLPVPACTLAIATLWNICTSPSDETIDGDTCKCMPRPPIIGAIRTQYTNAIDDVFFA